MKTEMKQDIDTGKYSYRLRVDDSFTNSWKATKLIWDGGNRWKTKKESKKEKGWREKERAWEL